MKKIKTLILVLMVILSVSIITLLSTRFVRNQDFFSFNFNFDFGQRETSLKQNETFSTAEIRSITVSVYDLDVRIVNGNTDEIIINHYNSSDAKNLTINSDNQTLTINQVSEVNIGFNWGARNSRLEIVLPQQQFDKLNINSVSGDLVIPTITANSSIFKTTSGDVTLTGITSDTIEVKSTSGDLSVMGATGAISAGTVSGDIDIKQLDGSVDISTTSGDIDVEGFTMRNDSNISSVSGDVEITFTRESGPINLDASSMAGDVENRFYPQTTENPLNFRIRTTSGDIELN